MLSIGMRPATDLVKVINYIYYYDYDRSRDTYYQLAPYAGATAVRAVSV